MAKERKADNLESLFFDAIRTSDYMKRRDGAVDSSGDQGLARANLGLVVGVVNEILIDSLHIFDWARIKGVEMIDVYHAGTLGLCEAEKRFDRERGFAFSTYAHWWIRKEILEYCKQAGRGLYAPRNLDSYVNALEEVIKFVDEKKRLPNEEELKKMRRKAVEAVEKLEDNPKGIEDLKQRAEKIRAMLNRAYNCRSLSELINDDEELQETIGREDERYEQVGVLFGKRELIKYIDQLPKREGSVVYTWFFSNGTLEEIGKDAVKLGIISNKHGRLTKERIRQIKDKGLRRLWCIMAKGGAFKDGRRPSYKEFSGAINRVMISVNIQRRHRGAGAMAPASRFGYSNDIIAFAKEKADEYRVKVNTSMSCKLIRAFYEMYEYSRRSRIVTSTRELGDEIGVSTATATKMMKVVGLEGLYFI